MTTPSGSWVRELQAIVGVEAVHTAHGQCVVYSRDATPLLSHLPDAVVFPTTREQVARLLTFATAQGIPVTPRGAGSSLCAGAVPLVGGIVLALTRMNQIIEINDDERLARVQPGVSTAALADAVAQRGMLYAPDPGSRIVSTIGGNVATCAGGLRGLKYGTTRNYVLGLEAVLATGEIISTGGRLEGTLAVITEVTLALLPTPATTNAGVAYFATLADAGRAVSAIIAAGVQPAINDRDAITRAQHAFDDIFRTALGLGGTITGEHGVGATKRAQLPSQLGVDQIALLQRIKRDFDPAGILNPGKVL